jgi:hypothetical protein
MAKHRKEVIGSYLIEEEAMNKINWMMDEGYRSEDISIIRDTRGVVEPLGDGPITSGHREIPSASYTSSAASPGSLFTPETSVAETLMELGISKEEAYRYEFDVKAGKVLILADPVQPEQHEEMDNKANGPKEEPALRLEEEDQTSDGGSTVNRPLPDENIDSSRPLDEEMLVTDPTSEKDYARDEVVSLHDQASVTREDVRHGESGMGQRDDVPGGKTGRTLGDVREEDRTDDRRDASKYTKNRSEEDVYKALMYEHGQPFPMEKKDDEDVYDRHVVGDGPLEMEQSSGDATLRERPDLDKRRPESKHEYEQKERYSSVSDDGRVREMEQDERDGTAGMDPQTEQPGDHYTNKENSLFEQEEDSLHHTRSETVEQEETLFEEDDRDSFHGMKKERRSSSTSLRPDLFEKDKKDDPYRK